MDIRKEIPRLSFQTLAGVRDARVVLGSAATERTPGSLAVTGRTDEWPVFDWCMQATPSCRH